MRIGRAVLCCKAKHFALIKLHSLTRGQIISRNDTRLCHLLKPRISSAEDIEHTLRDIFYIGSTPLHVGIIHSSKHLGKIIRSGCNCILSIYFLSTDDILDRLKIIQILEHHLMDLKDHGIGLSDIRKRFLIQPFQLLNSSIFCFLESFPLCINIIDMCPLDHFTISLIE